MNIFNSPVINLAILLSFIYLLGSIIITSVNEALASVLKWRSKSLNDALDNLFLLDPEWKTFLETKIEKSPHFIALQSKAETYPSYIPDKNFAKAIIDELRVHSNSNNLVKIKQDLVSDLAKEQPVIPKNLSKLIISFLNNTENSVLNAEQKIDDLENQLCEFYNNAMDRVTGIYKRNLNMITMVLSILAAVILNIDTIKIATDSLKNPQALNDASAKIAQQMSSGKVSGDNNHISIKNAKDSVIISQTFTSLIQNSVATVNNDTTRQNAKAIADFKSELKNINNIVIETKDMGLPVGYKDENDFKAQWWSDECGSGFKNFMVKLLGIFITAFALRLGAPYWFDVLNKVVNIRSAGIKPGEPDKSVKN